MRLQSASSSLSEQSGQKNGISLSSVLAVTPRLALPEA